MGFKLNLNDMYIIIHLSKFEWRDKERDMIRRQSICIPSPLLSVNLSIYSCVIWTLKWDNKFRQQFSLLVQFKNVVNEILMVKELRHLIISLIKLNISLAMFFNCINLENWYRILLSHFDAQMTFILHLWLSSFTYLQ